MSLLKKLALAIFLGLVLLTSLLFYLQTRHGFRHVIIPLAAKLSGAGLDARDGLLSLPGSLEVDGFVYDDLVSGISIDAERVALRAVPWSFITEGVPRIDDLELRKASVHIVIRPAPAGAPVSEGRLPRRWIDSGLAGPGISRSGPASCWSVTRSRTCPAPST